MRINLTSEDLAKGALVNPAWYPCEITKYEEKPSAGDHSTNAISYFKVLVGPFAGASSRMLINEKAPGFGKNFFLALGAKQTQGADGRPEIKGVELSPALVGKKLDVYLARGTSNKGNDFNEAKDFAPIGTNSGFKG